LPCVLLALLTACGLEEPFFEVTTGWLFVDSTPQGAEISLDGMATGFVTPVTLDKVAAGEHWVSVSLPGYEANLDSQTVTVVPGRTSSPEAQFILTEIPGSLTVTSTTPACARIFLDGEDTGEVTPYTFYGVPVGDHVVRVALAGYTAEPESLVVTVPSDQAAFADFTLTQVFTATKVVLLESFSNVNCIGCPELSAALHELMHAPGYGTDRVLLIKFSLGWPLVTDPHYQANIPDNEARMNYYPDYLGMGIPTLVGDGGLLGTSGNPPSLNELYPLIDALLAAEPGFAVGLEATVAGNDVPVTVTLTAAEAVDLGGHSLNVVLLENPVEYATPPGNQGETEFHWVMRDFETAETSLPAIDPCNPAVCNKSLHRETGWLLANLYVVAFVQNNTTREVVQAGFTSAASLNFNVSDSSPASAPSTASSGGRQP